MLVGGLWFRGSASTNPPPWPSVVAVQVREQLGGVVDWVGMAMHDLPLGFLDQLLDPAQ